VRKIVLLLLQVTIIFASAIQMPDQKYKADGAVTDIVYTKNRLYAATTASSVSIFDLQLHKKIGSIKIDKIKDFMGDTIDAKIYSVDILQEKVLLLSQAEHGYRKVTIFQNNRLHEIIGVDQKLYIAKAKFLDEHTILLGLLSNDIISYNMLTHKYNWIVQASQSRFSNFTKTAKKCR